MSTKLANLLKEIGQDPQVEAVKAAAAAKTANQPEHGMPAGGVTRSPMDGMLGNTQHDARARAEELALEQAGRQLEAATFDDPREAANARNLANTVGEEVKSPVNPTRQDSSVGNVHLTESPAQKAAMDMEGMKGYCKGCKNAPCKCSGKKAAMSFATYVEHASGGDEGVKVAAQALDPAHLVEYQKTAMLYYSKGANMALGHLAEAIGA
jgi:hypothetical protein